MHDPDRCAGPDEYPRLDPSRRIGKEIPQGHYRRRALDSEVRGDRPSSNVHKRSSAAHRGCDSGERRRAVHIHLKVIALTGRPSARPTSVIAAKRLVPVDTRQAPQVVIAVGTLDDPANPRVNAARQVRNHSPPQRSTRGRAHFRAMMAHSPLCECEVPTRFIPRTHRPRPASHATAQSTRIPTDLTPMPSNPDLRLSPLPGTRTWLADS